MKEATPETVDCKHLSKGMSMQWRSDPQRRLGRERATKELGDGHGELPCAQRQRRRPGHKCDADGTAKAATHPMPVVGQSRLFRARSHLDRFNPMNGHAQP